MYQVEVQTHFDAAHFLPGHPKCDKVHGHRWLVTVAVQCNKTFLRGNMVIDFGDLKGALKKVVEPFDHDLLNAVVNFTPTAENLARHIYYQVKEDLFLGEDTHLVWVRVSESPTSAATYGRAL